MKDAAQRYIVAAIKDVERLSLILSPNEVAIFRRYIREQSNRAHAEVQRLASEVGWLNAEIEKQKFAIRTLADHERTKLQDAYRILPGEHKTGEPLSDGLAATT